MNPTDFARDINYVYPLEMGLQAFRLAPSPLFPSHTLILTPSKHLLGAQCTFLNHRHEPFAACPSVIRLCTKSLF